MDEFEQIAISSTPYDDVFKSLLYGPGNLVIELINEMFGTHYTREDKITFHQNEFLSQKEGKKIDDSNFTISSLRFSKDYHIECQSYGNGEISVRLFEYDIDIAIDNSTIEDGTLTVRLPQSGVLFLRGKGKRSGIKVRLIAPNDKEVSYEVKTLYMRDYTVDDLLEKDLYFLFPYFLFTYDQSPEMIEKDEELRKKFEQDLKKIVKKLKDDQMSGKLNSAACSMVYSLTRELLKRDTNKYSKMKAEVKGIMGGEPIEAVKLYQKGLNEGMAKGMAKGIAEGRSESTKEFRNRMLEALDEMCQKGEISDQAAKSFVEKLELEFK